MEHKTLPFEIKFFGEDGTFEGMASFFGNEDLVGDIVAKGAFKRTLQERGDKIFVAWMHDWATPIGKPVEIREEKDGLYIKARISQTTAGRDALTLLRDGVIKELSIGYDVVQSEWAMADEKGNVVSGEKAKGVSTHPVRILN